MKLNQLLPLLFSLILVLVCAAQDQGPSIIFDPPSDWLRVKTASARTILLNDVSADFLKKEKLYEN